MPCPLAFKAPNTTIAEFANIVDSDETHNDLSHLNLQCLPSCLLIFNIQFELEVLADVILTSAFLAL